MAPPEEDLLPVNTERCSGDIIRSSLWRYETAALR